MIGKHSAGGVDVLRQSVAGVVDVEFVPEPVELFCASASGAINGIDGGTNSMLTRKIPKNTRRLFFLVTFHSV
tara:strand:- start:46 stop:264 length:219 start_codon:yes stop_codon:yes gene_type:complete